MKVKPKKKDFEAWIKCVPSDSDLLFFAGKYRPYFLAGTYSLRSKTAKEDRRIWTLNRRSWYGYALNSSIRCVSLKAGQVEQLSQEELRAVAQAQLAAKVPTLIPASRFPRKILSKVLRVENYAWITAASWRRLTRSEKSAVMRAWFVQNELIFQESIPLSKVPSCVRVLLREHRLIGLLHSFRESSGGNCFAAAAAFATKDPNLFNEWMLWKPLKKHLVRAGFKPFRNRVAPLHNDILVFQRDGNPVHAAIYLGDGIWFEKPGQDFYEPYRLVNFKNWKKEWPGTALTIFRR